MLSFMNSLTELVDIKLTLYSTSLTETLSNREKHPFCTSLQSTDVGLQKCAVCDKNALEVTKKTRTGYIYRCHAGLTEACFPIIENGTIIAYFIFGQILSDTSIEKQWQETKRLCQWYMNIDTLKDSYSTILQVSNKKIEAYAAIVTALTAHVWLSELVKISEPGSLQLILSYIEKNYFKKITLDVISKDLSMGKTTLCNTVKDQFGTSVNKLIKNKRIEMAKIYLKTTNMSISEVAERVGINDFNYFTKVFKESTMITPYRYRKASRGQSELLT